MAEPYKNYEMSPEVKEIEQCYWSGSKSIRDIQRSAGREKSFTKKMANMQIDLLRLHSTSMDYETMLRATRTANWLERVARGEVPYGR